MVTQRDTDGHSVAELTVKTQKHRNAWLLGPTKLDVEKWHQAKMIRIFWIKKKKSKHPFCILITLFNVLGVLRVCIPDNTLNELGLEQIWIKMHGYTSCSSDCASAPVFRILPHKNARLCFFFFNSEAQRSNVARGKTCTTWSWVWRKTKMSRKCHLKRLLVDQYQLCGRIRNFKI